MIPERDFLYAMGVGLAAGLPLGALVAAVLLLYFDRPRWRR
jgi:hypothetical protein